MNFMSNTPPANTAFQLTMWKVCNGAEFTLHWYFSIFHFFFSRVKSEIVESFSLPLFALFWVSISSQNDRDMHRNEDVRVYISSFSCSSCSTDDKKCESKHFIFVFLYFFIPRRHGGFPFNSHCPAIAYPEPWILILLKYTAYMFYSAFQG